MLSLYRRTRGLDQASAVSPGTRLVVRAAGRLTTPPPTGRRGAGLGYLPREPERPAGRPLEETS